MVLDGRLPLSEVQAWDLADVEKFNALLDMRADHQTALTAFLHRETEK